MLVFLAHVVLVLWLFGDAFGSGRLLYFRDLSSYYAPAYVLAADSLRHGIWPLWNASANAGEPFLLAYPVDLLLLLAGGWSVPLGIGAALHLLIALGGATLLARRLGMGAWAAWLAGAVYGTGGLVLSLVNLVQLFQAAAWAPWVIAAFLSATRRPGPLQIAALALFSALQMSTLGAEIVLQTALVAVVLACEPPWRDRLLRLVRVGLAAGLLAVVLAAPAFLGARALIEGTARGRGFSGREALGFSLHPVVLLEVLLPRWLGDVHAFSDADYWGRAYFPEGFPYFVTLYLGVPALLLAAQARRQGRLWALALLGVVLGMGEFGPLGPFLRGVTLPVRGPQKFFLLTHLALALLAGFGLERRMREPLVGRRRAWLLVPGLVILALVIGLRVAPESLRSLAAFGVAALRDPRAALAARLTWPVAWLPAGALALGASLALARGGRTASLAAVAVAVDLATVNAAVNPLAPATFYELQADVASLLRPVRAPDPDRGRIFSYGVAGTPGLRFEPIMRGARSDVWLYYLDRQALLPRTPALDGLDGAFEEDRTGWAPPGATFTAAEAVPERFRECYRRLRGAGVRWVVSFRDLPGDLVIPRGQLKLPEISLPLHLFELREALPRAYFVREHEVESDPGRILRRLEEPGFDAGRTALLETAPPARPAAEASAEASVRYEPVDAHTVRVVARTPPGFIVVLDGYHSGWTAADGSGRVPLLRANGRYRAIPTPGGERVYLMRFAPRWRWPALLLSAIGLLAAGVLLTFGAVRRGAPRPL